MTSPDNRAAHAGHPGSPAGAIIDNALNLVTDGKFIGLLTIMFGTGLEIQRQSAIRRGEKWPGRYPWRAGLLILDGLLNYIFIFEFDVLMGYGLTGLVVAAPDTIAEGFGRGSDAIGSGGYWDQVASRLDNFVGGRGEIPIMFTMGLGLFLVGAHLYRAGLFEERGARLRKWTMILSFGFGLPIDWALRLSDTGFSGTTRYVTSSMVAFGVLALVAGFYVRRKRRVDAGELPAHKAVGPVGRALSLVGRMALTCYIGQNLIASIIFYDWGFGVSAKIDGPWFTYWTLLIYLGIAAFLIAFSALWLRRFPRGPVELVWHWSYEAICAGLDRRKARKAAKEEPTADTGAREGNPPGAPVPATGTGTEPEPGAPANPRG